MKYLVVLLFLTAQAFASSWYVSTDGSSSGNGGQSKPWDLQTALNQPSSVKAGDTLWLRGGTYHGYFKSRLQGTASKPIIVRQFPGERASIDGGDSQQEDILRISSNYTWYWGFEIFSSDPLRSTTETGSFPSPATIHRGVCINTDQDITTTGNKFINLIIHDGFNGFGAWVPANTELYGCLVYNNGWDAPDRAHGHDLYMQNQIGEERTVINNIIWGAFENNVQAYGTQNIDDFYFKNNVIYAPQREGRNLLIGGGGGPARNPQVISNYLYDPASDRNLDFGWEPYGKGIDNGTVTGNYFMGGEIHAQGPITNTTIQGNTFYAPNGYFGYSQSSYPSNTYLSSASGTQTFVLGNAYEAGRAHIVVYNWPKSGSVSVDVSTVLQPGDTYEVRDAMNYFGSAVAAGTYNGGSISIPMTGLQAVSPIGKPGSRPHTAPEFGAFVLLGNTKFQNVPPPPPPVTKSFTKAVFLHHSVGGVFWDRSQYSDLTPPTTIPKEVDAYNGRTGYGVSMSESYFPPQDQNGSADNNWYVWDRLLNGGSWNGASMDYSTPIIIIKTCYIAQQLMTADSIKAYKAHLRRIVKAMEARTDNFFVVWNNYPAPSDGAAQRAVWSAQFSAWMKDTLAQGKDSYGTFPKNVYIFDVFRKLADPVTGVSPSQYASGSEGPGGDHPSNAAVSLIDPQLVAEVFNAAMAYGNDTVVTPPPPPPPPPPSGGGPNGSLTASPTSLPAGGGNVQLSWTSDGANTANVSPGVGNVSSPGNTTVSVSATTTFTLTLVGDGGTSTFTATVTVTAGAPMPPSVVTAAASGVSQTGAQLNGTLNPNGTATSYYFEYGTTTSYGTATTTKSAGSGSGTVNVSAQVSGLSPDAVYHYRLVGVKGSQTTTGDDMTFTTASTLGVERDEWAKPTAFSLQQNYPNPFNPSTTIRFALPSASHVSLKIYNVLGSLVADLVNGTLQPGLYSFRWNAASMANGVYFYRFEAGKYIETKRLLLLK